MSKRELTVYVASILTTLADLDTDAAESTVYMAMGMDLAKYELVRNILVASGLVTVEGYRIAITEKGKELAEKCSAALAH